MTKDRARLILEFLAGFDALERKSTDQAGWIALKLSVTQAEAEKLIRQAVAKCEEGR